MKAFHILGKQTPDQLREFDQRARNRIPVRDFAYLHAVTGGVLSVCLVKDKSKTGAHIILPRAACVPKQIMLRIAGKEAPMSASVVWQAGTKCGLEFNDAGCV
jgi:hypothetical protein